MTSCDNGEVDRLERALIFNHKDRKEHKEQKLGTDQGPAALSGLFLLRDGNPGLRCATPWAELQPW